MVRAVVVEESCAQGLIIGRERWWSAVEAGRRARRPLMVLGLVGASRSGGAIRDGGADDGTARAEAERRAGHPGRVVRVGGAQWLARAARGQGLCVSREGKRRREEGRKEKGKRKGEKEKERREKEEKGEKEKVTPAAFAASVASRACRRREAMRTRNEENRECSSDD